MCSDFYYAALVVLKEWNLLCGEVTRRYKKSSQEIPQWRTHAKKLAAVVGLNASDSDCNGNGNDATTSSNACQQLVQLANASLQEFDSCNILGAFPNLCIVVEVCP